MASYRPASISERPSRGQCVRAADELSWQQPQFVVHLPLQQSANTSNHITSPTEDAHESRDSRAPADMHAPHRITVTMMTFDNGDHNNNNRMSKNFDKRPYRCGPIFYEGDNVMFNCWYGSEDQRTPLCQISYRISSLLWSSTRPDRNHFLARKHITWIVKIRLRVRTWRDKQRFPVLFTGAQSSVRGLCGLSQSGPFCTVFPIFTQ